MKTNECYITQFRARILSAKTQLVLHAIILASRNMRASDTLLIESVSKSHLSVHM